MAGIAAAMLLAVRAWAAAPVDFAHDVLPILQRHCAKCHTNGRYEGDISFDTRDALVESGVAEPGRSADSSLIERVTTDDVELRMPLEAPPLSAEEIDVLRRWIDSGLSWQEGFSFKKSLYEPPLKPRRPELPAAPAADANPIDRIIGAYWLEMGVAPPKPLGDRAFYRRASLDLVGLLPTPEELAAFEADTAPNKRQLLVRRLLDDRVAYADHWLTFWNDLLRNDYAGAGYIDGGRKQITTWLYRALLSNKPYDQFVRELVNPSSESEGFANGFVWRGQVNASQRPELQFAQNVGQVLLGVNLKCASCHDSFIDHWKLTDSYGLAAIYSQVPLEIHRCDVPTGKIAEPYFLFSELGRVDPQAPREERLAALADLMTSSDNGRLTRTIVNRLWDRLMGRGIVFPVDALGTRPWNEDLLDYLAADLQDRGYDLKQTLELITTSQVYGSEAVAWDPSAPVDEYVFRGPAPKRMTAEQFVDAIWRMTRVWPANSDDDAIFGEMLYYASGGKARQPFVRASIVEGTLLMRSLGRPNREQVVTTRPAEMTTLEAVEMSNGQPLAELLQQGADQLLKDHPDWSSETMCRYLFESAVSRPPTDAELQKLVALAGATPTVAGVEDALWCIVMLPEFQVVR
ncbi:MAG: PSD1 and planctomycete cytochrome C domain-containing protein [Pirellulales bacterium]